MELVNISDISNPILADENGENDGCSNFETTAFQETIESFSPDTLCWLKAHTSKFSDAMEENTFIDQAGVRRYYETWKVVKNQNSFLTPSKLEDLYLKNTGCGKITFNTSSTSYGKARFLCDWRALWLHYENDSDDEIAVQVPLLSLFIDFFFHRKTRMIMTICFTINILATLIIDLVFLGYAGVGGMIANIVLFAVQYWIYLVMRIMYTGSAFGERILTSQIEPINNIESCPLNGNVTSTTQQTPSAARPSTNKHWTITVKRLCRSGLMECSKLFINKQLFASNARKNEKKLNFYDLLNISLKFLIRHNEVTIQDVNFNRVSYRATLLFVLFLLPIYVFYKYIYLNLIICKFGTASVYCNSQFYYNIVTFCNVTVFIQFYLFSGSVLVSLVGLAYGTEIAFQLTDTWVRRFSDLRKVGCDEVSSSSSSSSSSDETEQDREQGKEMNNNDEEKGTTLKTFSTTAGDRQFAFKVSRDAYEHYLFLHEFMSQAGQLWSPVIIGLFVFLAYQVAATVFMTAVYSQAKSEPEVYIASNVGYAFVRIFILCIYPVMSIAHANACLYALRSTFIIAAPDDYAVLGGRDKWTTFLDDVPAVWTLYGLWITWDKLFGLLWAVLTTCVAVGLTVVTTAL